MPDAKDRVTATHKHMHYATIIALIIANVTVLGLALLLTVFLGTSMGNIAVEGELRRLDRRAAQGYAAMKSAALSINENQEADLILQNQLMSSWTNQNGQFYTFMVSLRNSSELQYYRLMLGYSYDQSLFEYVPSGSDLLSRARVGESGTNIAGAFGVQRAHAAVSIDFSAYPDYPQYEPVRNVDCPLDHSYGMPVCDWTQAGGVLMPEQSWYTAFTFRLIGSEVASKRSSFFKRALNWFWSWQRVNAGPSIDFPAPSYGPSIDFPTGWGGFWRADSLTDSYDTINRGSRGIPSYGPSIDFPSPNITQTTAVLYDAIDERGNRLAKELTATANAIVR